jgi:hypothetical protein
VSSHEAFWPLLSGRSLDACKAADDALHSTVLESLLRQFIIRPLSGFDARLPEIAEQMEKSQEAVAGLIFRGMQKLREPLEES